MDFRISGEQHCTVYVDEQEREAVKIAVGNLQTDIGKVFGVKGQPGAAAKADIVVGTLGVSQVIDELVSSGRLSLKGMEKEDGTFYKEAYLLQVQGRRLVIAGTDRRGTIYGIYELCEMMGVSPWYFWADVPAKEKQEFVLPEGYRRTDHPSVEYRGIFINDEEELEVWVQNYMKESTISVKTYEKVFELLLRLKGNYIWPAMHVNSFNQLRENGALADRMGIVVGTSHCDMLMRSNNREWRPWLAQKGYEDAKYDYSLPGRNREILKEYWTESVEQNKDFEVCYTIGMRGIHDSGFETRGLEGKSPDEIKQAKIDLLSMIIKDQQKILKDTLGHDTMMTFIPYKEVLPLYDSGMEIPEEMTLVWTNDNYGYVRRYPSEKEKLRKGGNGLYYHNSYWAPPSMSYVFLCSIPLAHTRNELCKAYEQGIRKLWVLNVGAMKPLEQEIEFFLRLGWEIGREDALTNDVDLYVENWINRNFEGNIGRETAQLLNDFSQLTNTRKLENMDYDAYSQTAYGDEAVVRIHKYEELFKRGNAIYARVKNTEKDAFFQLVLMRIHAAFYTNLQYYYGDRSTLMVSQGKMQAAGRYAKLTRKFDDARRKLLFYYNHIMADGKWNGIVNPEGFPPPRTAMMPVYTPPLAIGKRKLLVNVWNEEGQLTFEHAVTKWIEIGNGGMGEFTYEIEAPNWLKLSSRKGSVAGEERILICPVDSNAEKEGRIVIRNLTDQTTVEVPVRFCPAAESERAIDIQKTGLGADSIRGNERMHYPEDSMWSVEADCADFGAAAPFRIIKRLGRCLGNLMEAEGSGMLQDGDRPDLEASISYRFGLMQGAAPMLELHRFPSLNSVGRIRIGVSVDDGPVKVLESISNDEWKGCWKDNVLNNVDRLYLELPELSAGEHILHFFAIDQYFAFSRLVLYMEKRRENNLAGITGCQKLPEEWDVDAFTKECYGEITLLPRPVEYAQVEMEKNSLDNFDLIVQPKAYAERVTPDWYLQEGNSLFVEKEDAICLDAAAVLAQSQFAYTSNGEWQYCGSESHGQSGLAMYLRKRGLDYTSMEAAPTLNYRISCGGGEYTIWLLSKFSTREESFFAVGVDGAALPEESLYHKGILWQYAAEQIYRYVPVARTFLTKGEHIIQLAALHSGLRFDRIYITKGTEFPPMD